MFDLQQAGTTVRREIRAGTTTFMTMAYIIVVHPMILADAGMPRDGVMMATCLAAAVGSFLMAFLTNYPFALAPRGWDSTPSPLLSSICSIPPGPWWGWLARPACWTRRAGCRGCAAPCWPTPPPR